MVFDDNLDYMLYMESYDLSREAESLPKDSQQRKSIERILDINPYYRGSEESDQFDS